MFNRSLRAETHLGPGGTRLEQNAQARLKSLYKHAGQLVYENVKRETNLKMGGWLTGTQCTKCDFIWGAGFLTGGGSSLQPPPPLSYTLDHFLYFDWVIIFQTKLNTPLN